MSWEVEEGALESEVRTEAFPTSFSCLADILSTHGNDFVMCVE